MTKAAAEKTFESEYLGIRCRLIELAAALDRIDRDGGVDDDPRMSNIRRAFEILADRAPDRAERIQMVFSIRD